MRPSGDLRGFELAYRAESPYVAAVLCRLAVPDEAVGDAVQDVFVAAYRRWDDFDRGRQLRPWLTGFARRVAFRYRRSAARRSRKRAALMLLPQDEPRAGERLHARLFLTEFLDELAPGHRDAFVLSEIEGRTAPEIADALGITTEAVYGRLRSTRRRLASALRDDTKEPDPRAAAMVPPWSLVLDRIGTTTSALTGATASWKVFAVTVGLGTLGLGTAAITVESSAGERSHLVSSVPRAASPTADTPRREAPSDPGQVDPQPETVAPVTVEPTPVDQESPRPATRPEAPPEAEPPTDSLAAEAALLRSANDAIARGEPSEALKQLDEHARTHPDGQLVTARKRSRIRALCDLGRQAQARGEAATLAREQPGDPLAQQALSICTAPIQNRSGPENGE